MQDGAPWLQDGCPQLQAGCLWLQDGCLQLQDGCLQLQAGCLWPTVDTQGHKRATRGCRCRVRVENVVGRIPFSASGWGWKRRLGSATAHHLACWGWLYSLLAALRTPEERFPPLTDPSGAACGAAVSLSPKAAVFRAFRAAGRVPLGHHPAERDQGKSRSSSSSRSA